MTGQNSGTSISATIPATAAAGQFLVATAVSITSSALTPPVGVTARASGVVGGITNTKYAVWTKTLGPGEPGTAFTVDLTGASNAAILILAVYSGVGGFSVMPAVHESTPTEALNDRPPRTPSIIGGPSDRIVAIGATFSYVSTNANSCLPTANPGGLTLRRSDSRQQTALVVPRGLALWDGPGGTAPVHMDWNTNQNVHWNGVVFALSPVDPRWTEIEKAPSTLAGQPFRSYSHSGNAYVKRPEANWGYNTRTTYGDRIAKALGGTNANLSLPGAACADVASFMHGIKVWETQAVDGDPVAVSQAGTWSPGAAKIVNLDVIGNDLIRLGMSTQQMTSFEDSLRAAIRRLQAGAIYTRIHSSVTTTGTWSTYTHDGVTGGSGLETTTPLDRVKIAVTDQPVVDVCILTTDNTSAGQGASYRVLLDGVEIGTGTTHNAYFDTNWGINKAMPFGRRSIRVSGIPAGAHLVEIEHTGLAGSTLRFDSWSTPSVDPPWIIMPNLQPLSASFFTLIGRTEADRTTYNNLHAAVVASENAAGRILGFSAGPGRPRAGVAPWDTVNDVSSDEIHQNEVGHEKVAHAVMSMLWEFIA
jgi:hypothetical protein